MSNGDVRLETAMKKQTREFREKLDSMEEKLSVFERLMAEVKAGVSLMRGEGVWIGVKAPPVSSVNAKLESDLLVLFNEVTRLQVSLSRLVDLYASELELKKANSDIERKVLTQLDRLLSTY